MSRNKRILDQLGMPHGTAKGRLRKLILLQLVQQAGRDQCFRCNQKIITPEELSIEHKTPWEGISAELFWDLNNIAFSHRACNQPDRRRGGIGHRKIGPEGTAWCNGCKVFEPIGHFFKSSKNWSGLYAECKLSSKRRKTKQNLKKSGGLAERFKAQVC